MIITVRMILYIIFDYEDVPAVYANSRPTAEVEKKSTRQKELYCKWNLLVAPFHEAVVMPSCSRAAA